MTKEEIFVVLHSNYSEGTDAYAFRDETVAKKSVDTDVEVEVKSLTEDGREPQILRRPSGVTVCAHDGDIYYEWEIFETTLEEEMPTLGERDKKLEELWKKFGDIPMDPKTECIDEPFLGFPSGTEREAVWRWFDERYSKGVAYLLCSGLRTMRREPIGCMD